MCRNLEACVISLYFEDPGFLVNFKVVISNSSLSFLKVLQSFSLDIWCFFTHFQATFYTRLFSEVFFVFFVKPLTTDL